MEDEAGPPCSGEVVSPPCVPPRCQGSHPLVQCLEFAVALRHRVPPAIAQHLHPEHLCRGSGTAASILILILPGQAGVSNSPPHPREGTWGPPTPGAGGDNHPTSGASGDPLGTGRDIQAQAGGDGWTDGHTHTPPPGADRGSPTTTKGQ